MNTDRDKLNLWQVSREISPLAEAGGIKDVVAGLSKELVRSGHSVTAIIPMYRFLSDYGRTPPLVQFTLKGERDSEVVKIHETSLEGIRVLLVSARCFLSKDRVYTYSRREEEENKRHQYGKGHLDSDRMNLTLQYCALEAALALGERPDLFHLHDGHCGFLPAIMRTLERYGAFFSSTGTLLTIHNGGIVYQQNISDFRAALRLTGLSAEVLKKVKTGEGYSPLLSAGLYGEINTVSGQYAREILSGEDSNSGELGASLVRLSIPLPGITNGIDRDSHDRCSHFPLLREGTAQSFDEKKRACRERIVRRIGEIRPEGRVYGNLDVSPERPLITIQSRLTYQKGIDVFIKFLKNLKDESTANFLVLGEGEHRYEKDLMELALRKKHFCYARLYERSLSADLFAGGDFFLIPSRWEPCGLTDFIAQLNGNIPVVNETGGLVKTRDKINGFSYKGNSPENLGAKIHEAVELYRSGSALLHEIRKNAVNIINEKYTWRKVLDERYIPLYRSIAERAGQR